LVDFIDNEEGVNVILLFLLYCIFLPPFWKAPTGVEQIIVTAAIAEVVVIVLIYYIYYGGASTSLCQRCGAYFKQLKSSALLKKNIGSYDRT